MGISKSTTYHVINATQLVKLVSPTLGFVYHVIVLKKGICRFNNVNVMMDISKMVLI